MRSIIYADDAVSNANRRFGAGLLYYVAELVPEDGVPADRVALLFTEDDINKAAIRAAKNPEDVERARRADTVRGSIANLAFLITGTLLGLIMGLTFTVV